MRAVVLTLLAVALVALYVALSTLPPQSSTTTSTQKPTSKPTTAQPTQTYTTTQTTPQPSSQISATTSPTTPQPAVTTTTQPQVTTTTSTQEPKLKAWLAASDVNTTQLPTEVAYKVVVENVGNAATEVTLFNKTYVVKPGESVSIERRLKVYTAGRHKISEKVGNYTLEKEIYVWYYTPLLKAEPLTINVTEIPKLVNITVAVSNVGNATGYIDGLEIRPGQRVYINATVNVTKAGRYTVNIRNLEVEVNVRYLRAQIEVETPVKEVEALPGEKIAVPIVVKNSGNATDTVQVGGDTYSVAPGEEKTLWFGLVANRSGTYRLNIRSRDVQYDIEVKILLVTYRVQIALLAPIQKSGYMETTREEATIEVRDPDVEIVWQPIIYTNATRRVLTLVVDGNAVRVEPGKPTYIPERKVKVSGISYTAPSTAELKTEINGTIYTLTLRIKLVPPTLSIQDVEKIEFRDTRVVNTKIKCTRPVQHEELVTLYELYANIDYNAGTFSGNAKIYLLGKTGYAYFNGIFNTQSGKAEIDLQQFDLPSLVVEFTVDPITVTKVTLKSGEEVQCQYPVELLPRVFKKPLMGPTRLDTAAVLIIKILSASDVHAEQVTRDTVVLRDDWGNRITVKVYDNRIEIKGAVEGTIYGRFVLS
jgi:hypothetical protein